MFVFGRNTLGATTGDIVQADKKMVCLFTLGSSETGITKLIFYSSTESATAKVKGLIYANSSGNPGSLLHTTNELVGTEIGWNSLEFASPINLTADDYFLGLISDTTISSKLASGVGTNKYNSDTYSDGPSDPFGTPSSSSYQRPIYAYKPYTDPEDTCTTDFSEYTVEQQPSDWTARWDTGSEYTVQSDAGSIYGSKVLRYDWVDNDRKPLSWDDISENTEDVEVVVLFRPGSTTAWTGAIVVRGSGGGSSEQGYFSIVDDDTLYLRKYINGTLYSIDSVAWDYTAGDFYFVRFRINGSSLKVKMWSYGTSEPGSWDIEATDTTIPDGGWIGVGGNDTNCAWDYVSIATGGGSAELPGSAPSGSVQPIVFIVT